MEGIAEAGGGKVTFINVFAIALVDAYTVRYLHDTALDTLEFIAGAGKLNEQEEVNHGMTSSLALTNPDSLYEDFVESGSFT